MESTIFLLESKALPMYLLFEAIISRIVSFDFSAVPLILFLIFSDLMFNVSFMVSLFLDYVIIKFILNEYFQFFFMMKCKHRNRGVISHFFGKTSFKNIFEKISFLC